MENLQSCGERAGGGGGREMEWMGYADSVGRTPLRALYLCDLRLIECNRGDVIVKAARPYVLHMEECSLSGYVTKSTAHQ